MTEPMDVVTAAATERRSQPEGAPATAAAPQPAIECRALRRVYIGGDGSELVVLDGVDLQVAPGEAVAIVGASGAGKSTLLQLLGGLDRPTAGQILLAGRDLATLSDRELAEVRNRNIGFVFQFHHLLREFTALENVMMPLIIGGVSRKSAVERARELLADVGLSARMSHRPWQLSGGEQQRVAVARALANRPLVVIADEPSGNLDTQTSEQLHDLFFQIRARHQVALIIATHNRELADRADRVLLISDRQLRSFYPTQQG
ncbi:MAG TPA: ABC transporter ATP-binding protein [Longimicrobiales bacterium]|nr:ABC transporter ATP-binding protein [Longimicrobiales bacterium]